MEYPRLRPLMYDMGWNMGYTYIYILIYVCIWIIPHLLSGMHIQVGLKNAESKQMVMLLVKVSFSGSLQLSTLSTDKIPGEMNLLKDRNLDTGCSKIGTSQIHFCHPPTHPKDEL